MLLEFFSLGVNSVQIFLENGSRIYNFNPEKIRVRGRAKLKKNPTAF